MWQKLWEPLWDVSEECHPSQSWLTISWNNFNAQKQLFKAKSIQAIYAVHLSLTEKFQGIAYEKFKKYLRLLELTSCNVVSFFFANAMSYG